MEYSTHPSEEIRRHIEKQKRLFLIAGAILFIGTLTTVAIATVPWLDIGKHGFDAWDCALGLMIASFKASMVLLIFMHLNHEKRWIYFFAGLAVVHCTGMGLLTLFAEADRIYDPLFYGNTSHSDTGGVSVAKGIKPLTNATPDPLKVKPDPDRP